MTGYLYSDGRVCSSDFCRKGYLYSDGRVCSSDFCRKGYLYSDGSIVLVRQTVT